MKSKKIIVLYFVSIVYVLSSIVISEVKYISRSSVSNVKRCYSLFLTKSKPGSYAPSELIIGFMPTLIENASTIIREGKLFSKYLSNRSSHIDFLNQKYGAIEADSLYDRKDSIPSEYVFKFSKEMDAEKAACAYARDPNVEYAQPNYFTRPSSSIGPQ